MSKEDGQTPVLLSKVVVVSSMRYSVDAQDVAVRRGKSVLLGGVAVGLNQLRLENEKKTRTDLLITRGPFIVHPGEIL